MLPDSKWRVHDGKRPHPVIVTPGTSSTARKAGTAPDDAAVLFDGTDLSKWESVKGGPAQWKVSGGAMTVTRTGDIQTKQHFGDCQLHLEFATPKVVKGNSQGRGNSGVFLMGRYEIQVLDGYDNPTYADGTTAAIYGQYPPLVSACRAPGEWQTYDIVFRAPRWNDGKLRAPAYITVLYNGIVVHNHTAAMGPTGHRSVSNYDTPHPDKGPLRLQDHGDKVRFRNIWMRELTDYDA
ncbi:DUF1080 domain-containing protein [Candidatus Poribacteria bacterium]|nr:DUF1080 domain-containing protein [Candidatus Poribacteria bacterium]